MLIIEHLFCKALKWLDLKLQWLKSTEIYRVIILTSRVIHWMILHEGSREWLNPFDFSEVILMPCNKWLYGLLKWGRNSLKNFSLNFNGSYIAQNGQWPRDLALIFFIAFKLIIDIKMRLIIIPWCITMSTIIVGIFIISTLICVHNAR